MFEDLIRDDRVRKIKVSPSEIKRVLERAQRDLKTAGKVLPEDSDWGFAIAYNAVLQASRAYMFNLGYRPASSEAHKNTFAFMYEALGEDYKDIISWFDRMRNKRHQAMYDEAGIITETEATQFLRQATEYVSLIKDKIYPSTKRP
ncbi:HEPN domain-containing protein [Candidatus Sumerlaeota bacterium]|nr:HEPN domain-containing protein [Candidatus Sumerlaeota bacterium]